jgi:hypothetical protein
MGVEAETLRVLNGIGNYKVVLAHPQNSANDPPKLYKIGVLVLTVRFGADSPNCNMDTV